MTIDRDEGLRRVETLDDLLVDANSKDPPLLNTLGHLLVRAGASERALPLFVRMGDSSFEAGCYARAVWFREKVLQFTPDDEATRLKLTKARTAEAAPGAAKRGAALYRLRWLPKEPGDTARALAVFMELATPAPSVRDVDARIARLEGRLAGGGSSTR